MATNEILLEQVLANIKENLDPETYNECFGKLMGIHKEEGGYIYIIVSDVLAKYRIERWHLNWMNEILSTLVTEPKRFKLISLEDANAENDLSNKKTVLVNAENKPDRKKRNLRSDYTFENFEIGESNRFAFVSATKVAESPHSLYNPLYIFGDVGLGKTHLMTAIGQYLLDNDINTNVVFTTAQQFTEDYFLATNTKQGKEKIEDFYNHYRSADILLVDDIQFLSQKTSTQEEFFKVFEDLYSKNKQIVITSDRSADSLENMMVRLKSRFASGLVAPIKTPDHQLCIKILKRKLSHLIANPIDVPIEVLDKLATCYSSNVRALEGSLNTYIMYCSYMNLPYTLENVALALENFTQVNGDSDKISPSVSKKSREIKEIVGKYYQITSKELIGTARKQKIVYARQMAMYLVRTLYGVPLKKIGDMFGGKDHTTIMHALEKIENSLNSDEYVKKDYDILLELIDKS